MLRRKLILDAQIISDEQSKYSAPETNWGGLVFNACSINAEAEVR